MTCENRNYTPEEMMIIASARLFRNEAKCFAGVGLPSIAACLARETHAPDAILIYESGAIGAKPTRPPLSIADPELVETASFVVSLPEIFAYWLQEGRIDQGFLGAAQIDRFGNINSTVIGDYGAPKVRLPGAGGAPHVAANAQEIVVIVRHDRKALVERLDFLTTKRCKKSTKVVTDLGILETDDSTEELVLSSLHPGVTFDQIQAATEWPLRIAHDLGQTSAPLPEEVAALRGFNTWGTREDSRRSPLRAA